VFNSEQEKKIKIPSLPLAVYREIAAHLQQLNPVTVEIVPQSSSEFNYLQSQVEGLILRYCSNLSAQESKRLQEILNYYESRHGAWEKEWG